MCHGRSRRGEVNDQLLHQWEIETGSQEEEPPEGLPCLLPQVSMKAARDPTAQPQQEASQVLGASAGRKTSSRFPQPLC